MNKGSKNMLYGIMVVFVIAAAGLFIWNNGGAQLTGNQPFSTAGAPPANNVIVTSTGGTNPAIQPTLIVKLVDAAKPNAEVSGIYSVQFDITNPTSTRHESAAIGTGVNVSLNDNYVVTVKPSSTYYAASFSGKIESSGATTVTIPVKGLNTSTLYIDNDSVVGGRNGELPSGLNIPDTATGGGTLNIKAHLLGVTPYKFFGDNAVAIGMDYNALQYQLVTFGQVTCPDGTIVTPEKISTPGQTTVTSGFRNDTYKIGCGLLSSQAIEVPITIQLQTTIVGADSNATIRGYDYATFVDPVSTLFTYGIENSASQDTNSATNTSAVMYYTN